VNASTIDIAGNWLPSVKLLGQIKYRATRVRLLSLRAIMATDPVLHKDIVARVSVELRELTEIFRAYEPLIASAEERQIWNHFQEKWAIYVEKTNKIEASALTSGAAELAKLDETTMAPLFNEAAAILDEDIELNDKGAAIAANDAQSA
jgi:methyl-accepting chemotaxis protein